VAADPAAAAEMVHRSGQRGVPVIVVDDQVVVGFDRPRLDQLLATRRVSRPRLGLSVADAQRIAAKRGSGPDEGADIGSVKASSAGERAGLEKGDVIVELAGRPVANAGDLETVISTLTVGQPVAVVFLRGGQRMQAQMTP
jgi:S1-C subfamily serine protease